MRRGIRMPPNMTKIFNYWGMSSKVGEIGVAIGRIIMSRRTRHFFLITSCPSFLYYLISRVGVPARRSRLGI